jgi:hypothetical protein
MAYTAEQLAQALAAARAADDQEGLLGLQMRRGQAVQGMVTPAAGANVGGTYRAASPLEHIANAMARVVGQRQQDDALQKMQAGLGTKRDAISQFMAAMQQGQQPQAPAQFDPGVPPLLQNPEGPPQPPPQPRIDFPMLAAGSGLKELQPLAGLAQHREAQAAALGAKQSEQAAEAAWRQKNLDAQNAWHQQNYGIQEKELGLKERELGLRMDAAKVKGVGDNGKLAEDLRKEFQGTPVWKNTAQVAEAYRKTQNTSETGAGDMSLIFGYMKLLDPNSTVREGEYATAANAGSVGDKLVSLYNRALSGEKLSPDVRLQFKTEAKKVMGSQLAGFRVLADHYKRLAEQRGIPGGDVVLDLGLGELAGETPAAPTRKTIDGKTYEKRADGWYEVP